jgi:hypothetical protein
MQTRLEECQEFHTAKKKNKPHCYDLIYFYRTSERS